MRKPSSAFDHIGSPIKLPELNNALSQFKEEMLAYLSQSESRMNNKITNAIIQFHSSKSDYESSLTSFKAKYDDISQSMASVSVKFDQLTTYQNFAQIAKDKLTSHEIRIDNLSKEINKIYYKYDKIYMDNLLLPGLIGECCKYKTTKDFFDDVISQLSAFSNFKEKNNADLKTYKERLESMMKSFSMKVDSLNKTSMRYTNDAVEDSEKRIVESIKEINERLLEMNIENSKYALNMKNIAENMTEEMKSVKDLKDNVSWRIESEIADSKKSISLIHSLFNDFKSEFKGIKSKFEELAGFIRDVRFRKNLGVPIDKKEITTLLRSISFQKSKTFEENNTEKPSGSSNNNNNEGESKNKKRLKPINEGETDDGNIGEVSNNELYSDCPNGENIALNRLKQMTLQPESPKYRQSITDNQLTPDSTHYNHQQQQQQKVIVLSPESNFNSRVNPFDLKKEQKLIGKKINIIEKRILEFEIYARDKLNELFMSFTNFLSITGINKSGLSLYGNLNPNSSRSNSINTNYNHKKQEINKEGERLINVYNKPVSVSVVDLIQKHPFPVITNQYAPIVNNNSVTKFLVQKKVSRPRGRSRREQIDKFVMQTLGSNVDEIVSSNKDKDMNPITGVSPESHRRGSIGNNNSSLMPMNNTGFIKKGSNICY